MALPSRRPLNPAEDDDDSSNDEREAFGHDAFGNNSAALYSSSSSSSRASSLASPLKTSTALSGLKNGGRNGGGTKNDVMCFPSSSGGREYSLDQKIPAPDPAQFLPAGIVEYIEVETDMSASSSATHPLGTTATTTTAGAGQDDCVSIISTVEATHYTPIDFHRTKGLIDSKRENANEREKLMAS